MKKVWFITGCSKGFGRILTEELLENTDAHVVATARNPETLQDLKQKYQARVLVLKLDVTRSHDIQHAVTAAIKAFGRIDVLVNNAGYGMCGALEECSMPEIRAIFDTNVFGLMEVSQAVLPSMRKQKSGHILNISSIAGLQSKAGVGIYNSTKFAVEGLSEALSLEVAHFGIKVTLIEPGPFRTDFINSLNIIEEHGDYAQSVVSATRECFNKRNSQQAGDPVKAAKIMIQISAMDNPPLRLPLGNSAMDTINARLPRQVEEFKIHEALSRSADF
jgi:NADP-dependent 3-hydroxy acid dehydrogenase YdfG